MTDDPLRALRAAPKEVISDDVRIENNQKLMLIGLYGPEIHLQTLPAVIPLAFTAGIVIDGEGKFRLSGKLKRSGSDKELLTFGAKVAAKKKGTGYVPFKFPCVNLEEAGTYEVSLGVEGQDEQLTELFEVKKATV